MCFIFLCLLHVVLSNENPEVLTEYGKIQGTYLSSTSQRRFAAFTGIPYAKRPIGNLRFEPPQTPEAWNFTLVADKVVECLQYLLIYEKTDIIGSEDCLYMNIYSPNIHPKANLDVVVFIHGGGFMGGSSHLYGPQHLLDHDIVYVSFNYRLNIFGFLSTEDSVIPGNNGMKDQVLALKWIKKNINNFGGNPNSITLTGFSAGVSSVHLHYLSPLSKNLFNQGISISGTAYNPWVISEGNLEKCQKLAKNVNCTRDSVREMVDCLKTVPANKLVRQIKHFMEFLYSPFSPFGLVVETKNSFKPFLTETPTEALMRGHGANLPWLLSVTENEGLWPAAEFMRNPRVMWFIGQNWDILAPFILDYNYTVKANYHRNIANKIKEFYFKEKEIDHFIFQDFVEMMGDRHFKVGSFKAAMDQARFIKAPVYFYKFSYQGTHSSAEKFLGLTFKQGISHGDDLAYLLPGGARYSSDDSGMKDFMTSIWVAFARTGNPTTLGIKNWPQVNEEDTFTYLNILQPFNVSIKQSTSFANSEFWNNLAINEL